MSRFNTGNPLGSNDPRDLDDNAKNMDLAVNAEADTFQDRLGRSRLTWAGVVKAGSGDPAIAVDAAARAEAAASQVQQDADQIAADAAQQAVSDVVDAVDGAVQQAADAADRAETARDAAFVNADVYPDIATGRAAVADGEQFQVVEGDEIIRYRRINASTQAEVARYPSAAGVLTESGSIFYADAFIQNAARTRAAKRAFKQIRFEGNNSDRKLALQFIGKLGTKLRIEIRDITDSADTFLITGSTTVEDYEVGTRTYTLPILPTRQEVYGSNVYITLDIAPFEADGYVTGNGTVQSSVFRDIEWGLDVDRIVDDIKAEVSQASVFVPSANFVSGGVNVNENIAQVVKSIKFSGDTVGLKPYINELMIDRDAGTATISISDESSSAYQQIIRKLINIPVSGEYITTVMTYENSAQEPRFRRDLVIEVVWKPELLQSNISSSSPAANGNYFRRGILNNDKLNTYEPYKHNSITDMLNAGANYPVQFAGTLPYRLSDEKVDPSIPQSLDHFVPMWNAIKLKRKAKYELIPTIPPSVVGHFNNHAIMGDIDSDGRMWFYGVGDKKGRVYYSDDEAQTLVEHSNFFSIWPLDPENIRVSDIEAVWCLRVLPNDELISFVTVIVDRRATGLNERRTYAVVTSGGRSQWNLCQFEAGGAFEMDHVAIEDGGEIVFEDPSRMLDFWGFDCFDKYALAVGYANAQGAIPGGGSIGHGFVGSIFLSEDYGQTWRQIFDYFNMPAGCTPFVNPDGNHHSHGGFFDHYHLTNGIPRIVGIMGDEENRLVISDDLGATWVDNAPASGHRNRYQQAVCGMAIPQGYLFGTDAVVMQGVEFTHRANAVERLWSDEVLRTLNADEEVLASQGKIAHVGVGFYQKTPQHPIITAFTPERTAYYDAGSRGKVLASWDGGFTWSALYDENETEFHFLKNISAGRVFQDRKNQVWFVPSGINVFSVDGSPLYGWVVKITYD